MKMLSAKTILSLVLTFFLLSLSSMVFSDTIVTDLNSGTSVSLVNSDGETILTNLKTGETLRIKGQLEGMTDEEYTFLMNCKRIEKAAIEAKMKIKNKMVENQSVQFNPKPLSSIKSGSFSGSFSISGSWETPTSYINETSVSVTITQNLNPTTITVTLYKEVDWWWDTSYGAKSFYPTSDTDTWTGLDSGNYYYLEISKDYTGYWTTGGFSLIW